MKSVNTSTTGSAVALGFLLAVAPLEGQELGFPEVEGWVSASEVQAFDAENLWEYINGAAELFVEYELETCFTGDLSSGELVVTVDYYNMGTPLNAFGVYVRERPDPGIALDGATEALVSPPYQALLLKGSYYVKVNVFEGELTDEAGRSLLAAIAAALPGTSEYPPELEILPTSGKVSGTDGFQREGFLGLTELTDCLYAEYGPDGESWQGFAMLTSSHVSLEEIWDRLMGRWESFDHHERTVLFREIPYRGFVGVIEHNGALIGASGAENRAQLLERLESLIR